jgi:hypothetical protein
MDKKWMAVSLSILFFVVGFLIMLEQYLNFGVWFQMKDVHHETFALSSRFKFLQEMRTSHLLGL